MNLLGPYISDTRHNLEDVQVGHVLRYLSGHSTLDSIVAVSRVTPTQVEVLLGGTSPVKFNKRTGSEVGKERSSWSISQVSSFSSQKEYQTLYDSKMKNQLIAKIQSYLWNNKGFVEKVPVYVLSDFVALLKAIEEKEKA